jgi:type IV pilus assembly protein PilX
MARFRSSFKSPTQQRGAVLYVALIMLILLALIGIIGMQVTGLQEKMSANYRSVNLAFQNAETDARGIENDIQASLVGAAATYAATQEVCSPTFDPLTWADSVTTESAVYTRRVDKCFPASSLRVGSKLNEEAGNVYEISVLASDFATNPTATAVINTIYIP